VAVGRVEVGTAERGEVRLAGKGDVEMAEGREGALAVSGCEAEVVGGGDVGIEVGDASRGLVAGGASGGGSGGNAGGAAGTDEESGEAQARHGKEKPVEGHERLVVYDRIAQLSRIFPPLGTGQVKLGRGGGDAACVSADKASYEVSASSSGGEGYVKLLQDVLAEKGLTRTPLLLERTAVLGGRPALPVNVETTCVEMADDEGNESVEPMKKEGALQVPMREEATCVEPVDERGDEQGEIVSSLSLG